MDDSPRSAPRWGKIQDWSARHPYWALTLLTVAALLPFLTKPFNLDDPIFIWAAQQIQLHPGNPYGFYVNWYGATEPMWAATQNPPLFCYYLALAAGIFGFSEIGLHTACLLPTIAVVLGTFRLAQKFCRWPMFAALATLFAPVFLISSTTVMSDVPMLAGWIWAVVFWVEGIRQNNFRKLALAGILTALTVLTKYNGLCLLPLLAAYAWLEKKSVGRWSFYLLIPLLALGVSEWITYQLYGQAHFLYANQYSAANQAFHGGAKLFKAFIALTFTGGGFALALFCAPFLWSRRQLLLLIFGTLLCVALAFTAGMMPAYFSWFTGNLRLGVEAEIIFWTVGGVGVLALAAEEMLKKRDTDSWLLALWVLGTFAFGAFVYWMVNGRTLLPMAPAVAILLARRLEQNRESLSAGIKISLVASAALSLLVAQADFQLATADRKGAEEICAKYAAHPGKIWFEGHWGFQYYMQSLGAWPVDIYNSQLHPGDILVLGFSNASVWPPTTEQAAMLELFIEPAGAWLTTFNHDAGAGFYSQNFRPLPFFVGVIPPEKFAAYMCRQPAEQPH